MSPGNSADKICVIAGMPRASTTFLYHKLAQHPGGFVPSRKELEFFSLNYARGRDWYLRFFRSMRTDQTGFDISPLYFFAEQSARLMGRFFQKPKVILIIREPTEFLVSFYKNRLAAHDEKIDFEEFTRSYTYRKDNSSIRLEMQPGVYERRISDFRRELGDNLLLVDYGAIRSNALTALTALESFCGMAPYFTPENFDNTYVNASNQVNIRFVNKLMHKKWFADLVTAVVPKKLTMGIRYKLQTTARRGRPLLSSDDEAAIAGSAATEYARDTEFVRTLFSKAPFILGGGDIFER